MVKYAFLRWSTMVLLVFCVSSVPAEEPTDVCGNINQSFDGKVTLSDVTVLIDHVYVSKFPLPNPAVANVDGSADAQITLADISRLIDYLYISRVPLSCFYHEDIRGICVGYPTAGGSLDDPDSAGYMYVAVIDGDIHTYHINAYYQCCLAYGTEYTIDGNHITIREVDLMWPDGCKCMCFFNLESVVSYLDDGEYVVTLIHHNGDTVGVDTARIWTSLEVGGVTHGDCIGSGPRALAENIEYLYQDGVLTMHHYGAVHNCALDLVVDVARCGDTIRIYEINMEPDRLRCDCPYDITAEVRGVEPGTYTIVVSTQWMDNIPLVVDTREVVLGQ